MQLTFVAVDAVPETVELVGATSNLLRLVTGAPPIYCCCYYALRFVPRNSLPSIPTPCFVNVSFDYFRSKGLSLVLSDDDLAEAEMIYDSDESVWAVFYLVVLELNLDFIESTNLKL